MDEINYQVEIENLLKIPKIKAFSELPGVKILKDFDRSLYYEQLKTKLKEIERERELTTPPPPPCKTADHQQSDPNNLIFIHNARQWQLLKESIKNGVFIDKLLIILSHEFLLYEREEIDISLENLCNYLMINYKKATINYLRKQIKNITDILIEREFINSISIKKSVLNCKLNTLFIKEMKEKRILTKIIKNAFSFSSDDYKIERIKSFFENNLNIRKNDLNIDNLIGYFKDTNKNRKKNEIKKILDMQ